MPRVIDELRAFDPGLDIVVIDDGSNDRTAEVAAAKGAHVLRLPFNLGIGGSVQTGFRYAYENGYELAVRVDGDGQHDPAQLGKVVEPVLRDEADIVVGSRFAAQDGDGYKSSRTRRIGIRILASVVSRIVGQRVTDPTSGFQALNRRGITLFARDYPHDYPEVEATVMVHRHRLRMQEVPVTMRERGGGTVVDHRARARSTTWSRCCSRSSSGCFAATSSRRRNLHDSARRLDRRRYRVVRARARRARSHPQPSAA